MKLGRWFGLAIAVVLVAAVGAYVATGQPAISDAKAAVRAAMNDPDAVRFSNIGYVRRTQAVCGQYNAKNGFGAYVGFKAFAFSATGDLHLQPSEVAEMSPIGDTSKLSPEARERLRAQLDKTIAEMTAYKTAMETFRDLCAKD